VTRGPTTAELMTAIRDLGARMDGRFERVDGRIDGVHARLDSMSGRIDTLIDAIADVRVELANHRHDD